MTQKQFFFVSSTGEQLKYWNVRKAFSRLLIHAGLKKNANYHGPSIHSFRHSFAVNHLIDWYTEGLNVEQHLPILSTYLGHVNPSNTYWYLSAHPKLLELAMNQTQKRMDGLQ